MAEVLAKVKERFGDAIVGEGLEALDPYITVAPLALPEVLEALRDDPDLSFDFLMAITGIDMSGLSDQPVIRVLYHLFSYRHRHTIVVRTEVPRDQAVLPSVTAIYPTAEWHEREVFDLLGVRFLGHPDLRRILLPEEWVGHPLRKDYEEGETALGFPTRRETLLDRIRKAGAAEKGAEG